MNLFAIAAKAVGSFAWSTASLALLAPTLCAQIPPLVPPGFQVAPVVVEDTRATAVRAVAFCLNDAYLIAIGRDLELRRPGAAPRVLLRLHPGEEFAFLAVRNGQALIGELHSGRITTLDLNTATIANTFAGPRQAFCARPLPSGELLISANPLWPAANAHTGVWLASPLRAPREVLALVGPSGPLAFDSNGDLLVAELGPIVPPPPGVARVLRFPASLVQQAIIGGTLLASNAIASGSGFTGIYDLAFDDRGRLHATDPASSIVVNCAQGSHSPSAITLDVGPGRSALWLQFLAHTGATFHGYQPPEHAPGLLLSHSDFAQNFTTSRLMPQRPTLAITPANVLPPGPAAITLRDGPPLGIGALLATTATPVPEVVIATIEGVPLWLGLPTVASLTVQLLPLDALGAATVMWSNPGGYAFSLAMQSAVFGLPGTAAIGSSRGLTIQLLP